MDVKWTKFAFLPFCLRFNFASFPFSFIFINPRCLFLQSIFDPVRSDFLTLVKKRITKKKSSVWVNKLEEEEEEEE
ncbi:hypothetical protein T4D_14578 [Trichinella pseudospiralis]|uniref:Uncharacterized protein n=1 Tax=Trichinella pseudospiralis TaxID=6337 RepID=A0A0V1F6K2_TRIPS|nr:hypothetical protein T4D_14578 [Trichinella pseudospiralis]